MTDRNIKFALRKNRIQAAIQRKKNRDTAEWNKNLHRHQVSADVEALPQWRFIAQMFN